MRPSVQMAKVFEVLDTFPHDWLTNKDCRSLWSQSSYGAQFNGSASARRHCRVLGRFPRTTAGATVPSQRRNTKPESQSVAESLRVS
jgi:hypothetical protein